jgi:hypothetical protein
MIIVKNGWVQWGGKIIDWRKRLFSIIFYSLFYISFLIKFIKIDSLLLSYLVIGGGSLWIGSSIVRIYDGFAIGRQAFDRELQKTEKIEFVNKLVLIYPDYLPEGFNNIFENKVKTETNKDAIIIYYYNNNSDSFIFLTESNGPLASELYERVSKQIFWENKGILITVNNPIAQDFKNKTTMMMDARWIYKGQAYNIRTDAISSSELEKIVESMTK